MTWRRFGTTLVAIASGLAFAGLARSKWLPQTHWALEDTREFWSLKIRQPPIYDIVVLGDSRVLNGVSPSAMEEELPGMRTLNFGFSLVGLNRAYLKDAQAKLDPLSDRHALVIGLSPSSLTAEADENNAFLQHRNASKAEALLLESLQSVLPYFDQLHPSPLAEYWRHFSPIDPDGLKIDFYRDGWQAVVPTKAATSNSWDSYRNRFRRTLIPEALVRRLMETVRRWQEQGIRCFGVRMPTAPELRSMENEMLGFDESAFARRFREAGGTWLEVAGAYELFDGDHLHRDSAIRFSRELGAAIRSAWK